MSLYQEFQNHPAFEEGRNLARLGKKVTRVIISYPVRASVDEKELKLVQEENRERLAKLHGYAFEKRLKVEAIHGPPSIIEDVRYETFFVVE